MSAPDDAERRRTHPGGDHDDSDRLPARREAITNVALGSGG